MIGHYSTLMDELKGEHRLLLEVFGRLKKSGETEDAAEFRQALADFRSLLIPHVVKEAYKVYTYLRQYYKDKGDISVYQRVTNYKTEMTGIGEAALQFIDSCEKTPDDAIDFHTVNESLREIGLLLGDRIRREEADLYPLYHTTE